jgi:hypothetical protein
VKILVAECPYCQPLHYPLAAQTFISKEFLLTAEKICLKSQSIFNLKESSKLSSAALEQSPTNFMHSRRRNKILVQVRYHCTQETLPSFTFYICTQYRANHESKYIL